MLNCSEFKLVIRKKRILKHNMDDKLTEKTDSEEVSTEENTEIVETSENDDYEKPEVNFEAIDHFTAGVS